MGKLKLPTTELLRKYSQVYPVGQAGSDFQRQLKERRAKHLRLLDSVFVVAGLPREPGAENLWVMSALRIFQEPACYYLTGLNQSQVILLLNPLAKNETDKEVLFVARKDSSREFWDGVRLGYPQEGKDSELEDLRVLTGIVNIHPIEDFDTYFKKVCKKLPAKHCYSFYHEYTLPRVSKPTSKPESSGIEKKLLKTTTDYNWVFKSRLEKLLEASQSNLKMKSFALKHFELRLPLDASQIKDVETASHVTAEAFAETLPLIPGLRNENELAALIEYHMKRRSPYGLSFPSIVASGKNATVLHYLKNDEDMDSKHLVLLDFGTRWGTMHADISRTLPVSGRFNSLQKLLYDIVLEAQRYNESNVRAGATIRDLNKKVWLRMEELLRSEFSKKGGKCKRAYSLQPHGVSHLMGEQEHDGDPHRLYQDFPLQPGWQISNEPGLYGHFSLKMGGKLFDEWIGIRIEDNLLVEAQSCKNLSLELPKESKELELAMK